MILRPLPFVALDVTGDVDAVRHFEREYGSAALPEAVTARVSLGVGRAVAGAPPSIERWHGRYRTVGWNASVTNDAGSTRIAIELAGRPRWFGLSLVQGYVVEPVLSVVAAEGGSVLLPAAAIEQNGSALVLLGSSGTGKSSLALRGLAAGRAVLGDDQILVRSDGSVRRFPRRARIYDDLRLTAPAAHALLPRDLRLQLGARRLMRVASLGRVAPSLAVDARRIGPVADGPLDIGRVVILERRPDAGFERETLDTDSAVVVAQRVLGEQRRRVAPSTGDWGRRMRGAVEAEDDILRMAFSGRHIVRISVPDAGRPADAMHALARELGID